MAKAKSTTKKAAKKATKKTTKKTAPLTDAQKAAAKAKEVAKAAQAKAKAEAKKAKEAEKAAAEAAANVLTAKETKRRTSLEKEVHSGQLSFVGEGTALGILRADRLYRDNFNNFDDYCSSVFDMTRVRSTQLIAAARIYTMLKAEGFKRLPMTESQCRPFSKVSKDKADETIMSIWAKIDSLPKGTKITASLITGTINEALGIKPTTETPTGDASDSTASTKPGQDKAQDALEAMRETVRSLKAKVAHLESALRSEKTAHARTKSMKKVGAAIPDTKLAKDLFQAGYRVLAKSVHPDHGGDINEMKELNELFTTLKNA